jgi:hypothetical protein
MYLQEVIELAKAKVVSGNIEGMYVDRAFCSDLMSDVLTIDSDNLLLITGLANIQSIRTAEMADVQCILLVRDKEASPEMLRIAEENNMVIMETSLSMYNTAGRLYKAGLKPVY